MRISAATVQLRPLQIALRYAFFRRQGYAVGGTLKPQLIGGSRAKARIRGKVSGARTELWIKGAHRGDILFDRLILDTEHAFDIACMGSDIVVEDGHLIVRVAALNLLPGARIPLDTLPVQFLKTLS